MSTITRTRTKTRTQAAMNKQASAAAATASPAASMQPVAPLPSAATGAAANGKAERRASSGGSGKKDDPAAARANKRPRTGNVSGYAAANPMMPTAATASSSALNADQVSVSSTSASPASASASSPQPGAHSSSASVAALTANSLLRQAALDRAARHNRTATNSAQHAAATAPSASASASSAAPASAPTTARSPPAMTASALVPPAPLRADSGSPTAHRPASSSSAGSGSGSGSGSRATGPPSGLRPLFVPSPQSGGFGFGALSSGGGAISTPVIYTGAGGPQASPGASPEPADEMAGFERGAAAFPEYASPSNAAAAAASSRISPSAPAPTSRDGAIACPLCNTLFPASAIEAHASNCDGTAPVAEAKFSGVDLAAAAAPVAAAAVVSSSPVAFTPSSSPTPSASAVPSEFRISSTSPAIPLPFLPRHHDTFKLLTWNVWFDDLAMSARMDAIGSVILREMPHVVALQEVTADSLDMIRRSEWAKHYHVSSAPSAPYFTLLATRFKPLDLSRLPFQSQMARDLLCANIEVPTSLGLRRISIATSHLESERRNAHMRRQQLDVSLRMLRESKQHTRTALYVGDMNLSGSEGADIPAKHGWIDGWLAVHGTARGVESRGATMDTKGNTMLRSRNNSEDAKGWKARLDRIWIRLGSGEKATAVSDAPAAAAVAASSSSVSAAAASASTFPPEWRVSSMDRVGLCSIDLSCPKKYAQKDYKTLEAESPVAASASSSASAPASSAAAASSSGSRSHASWGSMLGAAAATPLKIFPSDHFGLIVTMEAI